MVIELNNGGQIDVPDKVLNAALLVQDWMKSQGYHRWCLLGICSRNYADEAGDKLPGLTAHTTSPTLPLQ